MESTIYTDALTALGHPGRLAAFRLLARRAPGGVRPSEMAEALDVRPNTLSVHLATLERAGLITSKRDGKSVFYRLDLDRTAALLDYLAADCCRGRPDLCAPAVARAARAAAKDAAPMTRPPYNVLFICTGNSARSVFAEAILATLGGARFRAFSAGVTPAAGIHPMAGEVLDSMGHDAGRFRPKDVSGFQGAGAPPMDFVFTVCDRAANEECPPWPGQPLTGHWGIADPTRAEGTRAERALAFREAYRQLNQRILAFAALPIEGLDRIALQRRLDDTARG